RQKATVNRRLRAARPHAPLPRIPIRLAAVSNMPASLAAAISTAETSVVGRGLAVGKVALAAAVETLAVAKDSVAAAVTLGVAKDVAAARAASAVVAAAARDSAAVARAASAAVEVAEVEVAEPVPN